MTPDQFRQTISTAVRHHQSGQFAEAESLYLQILAENPNEPDTLHLLGALAGQTGRLNEAIDLISKAIAANPNQVVFHCNLSEMFRRAGKVDEAISSARQAIRIDPKYARGYCVMGSALTYQRKFDEAVAAFRRAVDLNPNYIEAHNHLASTFNSLGQFADAIAAYRRLLKLTPDSSEALCGLAVALRDSGQPREAITILQKALEIQPNFSAAHNTLGIALSMTDQIDDAIASFRRAVEVQPDNAMAVKNLGVALAEKGLFDNSLAALDQAIQLKPDLAEAHGNRALMLLVKGNFAEGWSEYEWRWRAQLTLLSTPRNFSQPRWDGSPLNGKTILLHAEQGFGDTIQFVRYFPMVAERGGRIVLECPIELIPLLRTAPAVHNIVATGQPLPRFDCHCPLLSLPLVFKTDLDSIPAKIPYVTPDPAAVAKWKSKIDSLPAGPKVGIVWAGNPKNKLDRKRSIPFNQLTPILTIPGIHFISLQKGGPAKTAAPSGTSFIDWTAELLNFSDTAALVANLDLVIAVDTAVAHLTGAIGKPIWIMIPYVPDWRWLLNRTDSQWYPTMRIFRQQSLGDWPSVIQSVAAELKLKSPIY